MSPGLLLVALAKKMDAFREAMRPFYYDPERYDSCPKQLGIECPTVRENQREN